MNTDNQGLVSLKLFVQQALLGEVTANMAAVCVKTSENCVCLHFFLFEGVADCDRAAAECASAEVLASYPENYSVETTYKIFTEIKQAKTQTDLHFVFLRSEALL